MWEDIRTWVQNNRLFVLPDLAIEVPTDDEYLAWKN